MKKGIIDRILAFMGFEEGVDEVEFPEDQSRNPSYDSGEAREQDRSWWGASRSRRKVVPLESRKQPRVVVAVPKRFEDVVMVADHLKSRRPVIVNVATLERELAKRLLDFASGVTFALDGSVQKVAEGVFLFAPNGFDVSGNSEALSGEGGMPGW